MIQNENKNNNGLVELGGSNFKIADGEPNIKGWEVKNKQGQEIGEVDDLLFDVNSRAVKYIIVNLNDVLGLNDKKVLIPIDVAELRTNGHYHNLNKGTDVHEGGIATFDGGKVPAADDLYDNNNVVVVPVNMDNFHVLPDYKKGGVTDEQLATIFSVFNTGSNPGVDVQKDIIGNNDYTEDQNLSGAVNNNPESLSVIEENLQVGKRTMATGGTRLTSRIVEKPVERSIDLKDEHVTVVRTPVNRPASSSDFDAFKEEQIEMREYAEVPVVNKEARIVEEIVVSKEVLEKEETIKETLRNTEVTTEEVKKTKTRKKLK